MATSPLLNMVFGYMPAQILYVATELRVADELADGPRTGAELAVRTTSHPSALRLLLRAMAAMGLLVEHEGDRFELTEMGGHLRADSPESIRGLVLMMCGPEMWGSWGGLLAGVRTGETQWDRVNGKPQFEYYQEHPELSTTFNTAMSQHTRDVAPSIIGAYDFARFEVIADVGGGDGTLLTEILRTVPGPRGVLFDTPAGLEAAPATLAAAGLSDRCRLVPGDFFASVPEGADAYVLKQILHDWSDEQAIAILRNCRRAMASAARVVILERMLPERAVPEAARAFMVDMTMLLTTSGKERTEREFRDLLSAAGFTLTAVTEPLAAGYRVIEGVPADA
jgi:O-methyltransferase domain/Dimerisation domain